MCVCIQFAVGSKVEKFAGSVVGTGREGVTIREESAQISVERHSGVMMSSLDCVDV